MYFPLGLKVSEIGKNERDPKRIGQGWKILSLYHEMCSNKVSG